MKIGIIGLGLIGGSFARAFSEMTEHEVYGWDISESTILAAEMVEAIDGAMDETLLPQCDLLLLSLYPQDTVTFIREHAQHIKPGAFVIDCCGVKRTVCEQIKALPEKHRFLFIGGHPMAGTQLWGFSHSRGSLFKNASMILTPDETVDIQTLDKIKQIFCSVGFSGVKIATPEEHDRMIAFTSQLAHVVSNAYVKSPSALMHKGFSAGSYKDLTRVAKLNEDMWTELFLDNGDFLAEEIDGLIENLKQYSSAIKANDADALRALLKDGKDKKILAEK